MPSPPYVDATTVPSVQWWLGLTSSPTPALAHTNTWRSNMSVFPTVSTALFRFDKCFGIL